MSQTIIQVEHLNLSYRNVPAVQDVSFTVNSGEIIAVIGQNGSGKTSAVECIEGLRKPDSGQIRVFGKDPWLFRSKVHEEMGVQLQETEYPSKLRVQELCRLFAGFYERPADWNLLLTQLGLDHKRKAPIHKLSGGEKQRLSILLSLMGRPKLLVLDELTTGLDPEVRQNMWSSFQTIRDSGVAILMVSHYLDEVEALAGRILYLEKGRQLFFGTQGEFREYVKNRVPKELQDGCTDKRLTLEQLYLLIAPRTTGLTMEGIL